MWLRMDYCNCRGGGERCQQLYFPHLWAFWHAVVALRFQSLHCKCASFPCALYATSQTEYRLMVEAHQHWTYGSLCYHRCFTVLLLDFRVQPHVRPNPVSFPLHEWITKAFLFLNLAALIPIDSCVKVSWGSWRVRLLRSPPPPLTAETLAMHYITGLSRCRKLIYLCRGKAHGWLNAVPNLLPWIIFTFIAGFLPIQDKSIESMNIQKAKHKSSLVNYLERKISCACMCVRKSH